MSASIAVILNSSKELSSFEEGCILGIYYKETGNWQLENEIFYSIKNLTSLIDIRNYIKTVIQELANCKIVTGKSISGLAYNIFDRMGFAIFETETLSGLILDEILDEVQAASTVNITSDVPTSPVQTDIEGEYFLNLIDLQQKHPEISSKKALRDFIDSTPFYRLELICTHMPPWLELAPLSKKLNCVKQEIEKNKFKVILTKKVCDSSTCTERSPL